MIPIAEIKKKMSCVAFSFIFFILVPCSLPPGSCDDFSFSICWMTRGDTFERADGNIWLNDVALKAVRSLAEFTSLTVSPTVENKLSLQYEGSVHKWAFSITPSASSIEVRGLQKPQEHPSSATRETLQQLSATEVFACENGTLFFHQDENFILAIGHTLRLPVGLESRGPSMLLVSWMESRPAAADAGDTHSVSLYLTELGAYTAVSRNATALDHYLFSGLGSCSPYLACVELAGTQSLTCLSTVTDPDEPGLFQVTSWNSSSITVAWDSPDSRQFSVFLLTAFYLDGTDHVTQELPFWQRGDRSAFTLSDLAPCSRVKLGLQTVCQAGPETRHSKMVLIDGNSEHSNIDGLRQTSSGPDSYTLSWDGRNTSSISMFRVYHEGALQASTLITNHTVGGLQPCQPYLARVEALCGEGVVMSTKTVAAHTGPRGVSDLTYRPNNSTAMWTPGTPHRATVTFLYNLTLENGTAVRSSRVSEPELRLPGLADGETYLLDVREECGGRWKSSPSLLSFDAVDVTSERLVLPVGPDSDLELQSDFSPDLVMVVPWLFTGELQDTTSEPRVQMEKVIKNKVQQMLGGFHRAARVQLGAVQPLDEDGRTQIVLKSFDASVTDADVPLPVADQLDHIQSLQLPNITVSHGVVSWDGPDECASSKQSVCPSDSLCINTLGSYMCVCRHGYYDVASAIVPSVASPPVCSKKGLFSRCQDKMISGGVAKAYLVSLLGGKVDVELNDGRCVVNESETSYYFNTSRKTSECGTRRLVNKTHIEYQNTLSVTLSKEHVISRRDLQVVWKCVYPRNYVRNAQDLLSLPGGVQLVPGARPGLGPVQRRVLHPQLPGRRGLGPRGHAVLPGGSAGQQLLYRRRCPAGGVVLGHREPRPTGPSPGPVPPGRLPS
ncbi:uncharacterized protein LOC115355077 isoform X2 [Myripristis murdjan]|uniref:uncharacterized protein LOC115355077 isoform X2 n=1 Tax=Myripristis murdjan TaxID=586833 RepID=UPI0011764211|nr:uncharacterized protein LOC115355077 isoform X2 [Myripristis murdjan]